MLQELQIGTNEKMPPEEFHENFFLASKPCLFKGAAANWEACGSWTPEYLAGLYGNKMVDITISDGSSFKYSTSKAGKGIMRASFKEALDLVRSDFSKTGLRYYLMQKSLAAEFPELLKDLRDPEWLEDPSVIGAKNIWIGNDGNVTNLHYDLSNNFLVQVCGRKVFTLFSPLDYHFLYVAEKTARSNLSVIDPDNPDFEKYPLYAKANPIKLLVEAGDILYMPSFWWHHVRSLDFTISVNYWWRSHIRQCLNKPALDMLHRAYEAGVLIEKLSELDIEGYANLSFLTDFYLESGVKWAAVLVALSIFEEQLKMYCMDQGLSPQKEGCPLRLADLDESFWQQHIYGVLSGRKIARWKSMGLRALTQNDEDLVADEIDDMIREIRLFKIIPSLT